MKVRLPRNPAERVCVEKLLKQGWTVHRKGWPDLLCERAGEFMVVQVKEKRSRRHKKLQARVMSAMAARRIPAFTWIADEGFVPVAPARDRV